MSNATAPCRENQLPLWYGLLVVGGFLLFRIYVSFHVAPPLPASLIAHPQPDPVLEELNLKRGPFTVRRYTPGAPEFAAHPKAIIIFGSGDGGFSGWEDRVCAVLQTDGYEMIGYDCAVYAATDYDLTTLQADMATIVRHALARHPDHPPAVILGGWSMGAEQAVAAAGGPDRPAGIVGILAISPGSRGRYGLRAADRWDIPPLGPGTFALADFAHSLVGLRVVQWDGRLDLVSSATWLNSVTTPHQARTFALGLHDYNGACDDFLNSLKQSITWILSP